ncbi:TolC family protein [Lamprobacter modestohalophilus]|uniref:TolC family protein n=1 Tax=Lamprobacter modestohalophilus TaxID=1064514 RepID=UPI002ADEB59B|nr:TolC family protein [Lamprobacter modestohalophilus]MEA1048516.1 TolC family protein [Lamprobacter modestohalophilus]
MTLAEAVAAALEQAGQLIRTDALRGEADAVRRQAGAWTAADPALRLKGVSDRFTGDDGAYEVEALLELPLWLPGQRRARLELANSLGLRAEALARLLRWEVAGAVRDAVWAAKLAEVQLQQANAAYEAARGLESVVAKRYDAGELARLDLLTAQQETLARQAELTAARADWEQAKAAYVQITGRLQLPEPPNWPSVEPITAGQEAGTDSNAYLDQGQGARAYSHDGQAARGHSVRSDGLGAGVMNSNGIGGNGIGGLPADHPLLAEADAALARARAEREQVVSDRRGNPILSLGSRRTRDARAFPDDDALQLELSIPFGLASQSAPEIAASERQVTERLAELHRMRREAERELVAAVLGRRGAAEALQVAERRASLAADALSVAQRAFELGETDLAERLLAERRAREAHLDLALRRAEQGQALARVNQALGMIPQ